MMAIKAVYDLFCDSWKLYQKYMVCQLNEKELDLFVQETKDIFQKYDQEPLAKDLMVTVTSEIERRVKNKNLG